MKRLCLGEVLNSYGKEYAFFVHDSFFYGLHRHRQRFRVRGQPSAAPAVMVVVAGEFAAGSPWTGD